MNLAPTPLSPSLPPCSESNTCSLVNHGLPPGIIPHGLVTNVQHSCSHRIAHTSSAALIPTLTVIKKKKSNFCYKPVTKIHNTQTACLKTLSKKGWNEYNDHEQTNKSEHSLVSEGALFTYCSSLPPLALCPERSEWTQASCWPKSIKITENLGSARIPDHWKQLRGHAKKLCLTFAKGFLAYVPRVGFPEL